MRKVGIDLFIERTFKLCEFNMIFLEDIDLYIFCKHKDERGDFRNKDIKPKGTSKLLVIEFIDNERIIIEDVCTKEIIEYSHSNILEYFKSIVTNETGICLDMTDMDTKLLAIILAKLKILELKMLFVMYSHPQQYLPVDLLDSEESSNYVREFMLNDYYKGVESIPSYFHLDVDYEQKKQIWIVFLGFDRNRTSILDQSKEIDKNIIPVISLPAARPGWDKHAFNANFDFFEKNSISDRLRYVSYSSPFETYAFLNKMKEDYHEDHLIVSPLGVKPTTLGALLFILNNPEVELLFDNPIIKRVRSEGIIDTHVYDVTNYLKGIE